MARTPITPVVPSAAGVAEMTPVATDTTNGNVVTNASGLVMTVTNSGGSSATLTFITSATVDGYAVEDVTVTLAAAETKVFGHFPSGVFGSSLEFTSSAALDVVAYR